PDLRRAEQAEACFYFRCLPTSLVMSNMLTCDLPPKTGFSLSSALIMRRFLLSCRPFFLMYAHSFLVTSVRGIGFEPITSTSLSLGWTGRKNAAFAFRPPLFFFAFLAAFFFVALPAFFFAAFFFAAFFFAIWTPSRYRSRPINNAVGLSGPYRPD